MSWIVLEGLDRSGKSSVAELYHKRGFEVVHLATPDKKYRDEAYVGPSYLDEMIELFMKYDGKDVIFDRSPYGELIWPQVFNRKPLLTDEDFEILREFEAKNQAEYILMIDPNKEAHWKRCVDNKEPLNRVQFNMASALYGRLAHSWNFIPRQLSDFISTNEDKKVSDVIKVTDSLSKSISSTDNTEKAIDAITKLERANAISQVLSTRIVKKSGGVYDDVEKMVRSYLLSQIEILMGNSNATNNFSSAEVQILKEFCKKVVDKTKN